jgi:hypothetical protein
MPALPRTETRDRDRPAGRRALGRGAFAGQDLGRLGSTAARVPARGVGAGPRRRSRGRAGSRMEPEQELTFAPRAQDCQVTQRVPRDHRRSRRCSAEQSHRAGQAATRGATRVTHPSGSARLADLTEGTDRASARTVVRQDTLARSPPSTVHPSLPGRPTIARTSWTADGRDGEVHATAPPHRTRHQHRDTPDAPATRCEPLRSRAPLSSAGTVSAWMRRRRGGDLTVGGVTPPGRTRAPTPGCRPAPALAMSPTAS